MSFVHSRNFPCGKTTSRSSGGFTLVELLLVVGLLAITVGVTSDILLSIVRTYNKTQVTNEIEQQAAFFTSKLEKELRRAQSVEMGANNSLVLTLRNSGEIVTYSLEDNGGNGRLTRATASGLTLPLTVSDVVSGVRVSCGPSGSCFTVAAGAPTIVSYSLTFQQANSTADSSFTGQTDVENVIVIRNTY
jgi:type II secretory pathway pseudopilin PulG